MDYGVGNLVSVINALSCVGATPDRVRDPRALAGASAIVLPGVGHFATTTRLNETWREAIADAVRERVPLLGICLGMQWLFDGSTEAPGVPGLGALQGTCAVLSGDVKIPHVGWNTLERAPRPSVLLDGIPPGAAVYFTHSYAAPVTDDAVASTTHGATFASVVERGRVLGVQWHPEKSGRVGLALLANFTALAREAAC